MKRLALIFFTVVLVIAIAGGFWWHEINVVPTVVIPTPTMPKPNAFDYFVAASKLEMRSDDVESAVATEPIQHFALVHGHVKVSESAPAQDTLAEKEDLVRINEPALAKLRKGLSEAYAAPPTRSFTQSSRFYVQFIALGRLLELVGHVDEAKGDMSGAVSNDIDAIQFGEQLAQGSDQSGTLVGDGCAAKGRKPMWKDMARLSPGDLRKAAWRLELICATEYPLVGSVREEAWAEEASMQELLSQPGYPRQTLARTERAMGVTEISPVLQHTLLTMAYMGGKRKVMGRYNYLLERARVWRRAAESGACARPATAS